MSATPDEPLDETVEPEAIEPEPAPAPEPAPELEPEPELDDAPLCGSLENPIVLTVDDGERIGSQGPPFNRTTAITQAQAIASQQSQVHGTASAPLTGEQVQRVTTEFLDQYDSRWSRDPGRANGPYS